MSQPEPEGVPTSRPSPVVRTRFAPSPTGYLHIGGVRTALFNWLLARRHGGRFILRIDDTDQVRNVAGALQPILDGFRWLGVDWDEGPEVGGPHAPYFQSQRAAHYAAAAQQLVAGGHAYPCYCTPAELDAERKAAERARTPYRYSGRCRALSDANRRRLESEGRRPALRFRTPQTAADDPARILRLDDLLKGPLEWDLNLIGDFIIVKANGQALYNFATVVDDSAFQISHVIRAEEHLSNTPPQLLIYDALGAARPRFAHLPYVAAPGSRKKMSKRDLERYMTRDTVAKFRALGWPEDQVPNPVMLAYYEALGYLPEAVMNYLARLGWSLDEKREKIGRHELIASFSLDRVTSAPASHDPDKLYWLEGEYMRELPVEAKVTGAIPFLVRAGLVRAPVDAATRATLTRVIAALGDRLKLFSDVVSSADFFFRDEIAYDPDAVKKRLVKEDAPALFAALRPLLATVEPFDAARLEELVRQFAERQGINAAKVIHALRVATTGKAVGPGVFDCLAILGRERTLQRIERAVRLIEGMDRHQESGVPAAPDA